MPRTRRSLFYLAGYLWPTGILMLAVPQITLKLLLSNGHYGDVMPRMAGMFLIGLAIIVTQIIRLRAEALYFTTVIVRLLFLVCFAAFYAMSRDPLFLSISAVVAVGVLITGTSYLSERR